MANNLLTDLSNVLETKMRRDVPLFINLQTPLLSVFDSKVKVKNEGFNGEYRIEFPVQFAMAEGFSWSGEGAAEPTATAPSYNKGYLNLKKYILKDTISEEILDLVDGKKMALAGHLRQIMVQMTKRRMQNIDAALHGDSTGALATCVSANNTTKIVTVDSTKYLRQGMILEGYDASGNHDADGITVRSVSSATTFLAGATDTLSSIDSATVLYHEDPSYTYGACQGIDNIIDDDTGTFQGLSRNTYPSLRAYVREGTVPGTPEAYTDDRVIALLDDLKDGIAAVVPDLLYAHTKVRNSVAAYWRALGQPIESMPAKGGLPAGLRFVYDGKEIPIVSSSRAADYTMFALSKGNLGSYGDELGHFVKANGSIFEKNAGYHTYNIQYTGYLNYFSTMPCANGRLNDITHTSA